MWGVRVRTAAAATLAVAVVLAIASIAFVLLQRHQLEASLTDVARQQATDVARQAAREGTSVDLVAGGGEQSLVQVVNAAGRVIAASPSVEGEPPVVKLAPPPGRIVTVNSTTLPISEGNQFVVVARGTNSPDGQLVVLVAQSLEAVQESTSVVSSLLAFGYPVLLLVVALTSYWLTGRALAPVEAIRRRVASIEGTAELSARVPVPGGNDELSRLAETMNSMLIRLQAGSEAQRRFIGDASHELRSPLATIRAVHEVGALHPESADWPQLTHEVLEELGRIDRLVSDMLLLARADEHGLTLRVEDVDLDDLVAAEAVRLQRAGVPQVVVSAPPLRIRGDRHQLARALRNLSDNAARHARSRVELRTHVEGRTAVLEVLDDGMGIRAADRDRVFERFVRLDQSRARDSGGTGLGLPIARQIAQAHGGELVLRHTDVGACFALTLPLDLGRGLGVRPSARAHPT
ncbi:MAG: ATP-binding region, ATPase domain protein [Nocardioides sp.]|jgi:signal transduction histidine kinase|nr:ATP-binding region, ATPase domain protein [Nocardioides sp.]